VTHCAVSAGKRIANLEFGEEMRRWIAALAIIFFALAPCWAHVGSPDVYFQGLAGPYHLSVTIRTPAMIPGVASVEIRSTDTGVSGISVVPLYIVGAGAKYPPPPDPLTQSKEDPQFFSGKIWLMESGSWQVRVQVNGSQGAGEIAVPVPAAARNTLPMQKSLGVLLFALMTLLFLAIVSILGAARREGTLEPGREPEPNQKRRGRWVMFGTAVIVLGILFFGNMWWNSEARAKALQMIYTAPQLNVSLEPGGKMVLRMGDSSWHTNRPETVMTKLIPDHGHLMHLFLIRVPQMDRFYHLHPDLTLGSPNTFTAELPHVTAGHYQVFADVVRESGFPDTMVTAIDLPDISGVPLTGDNSDATAPPIPNDSSESKLNAPVTEKGVVDVLPDGSRMVWERGPIPLSANHFVWLRFRLEDPQGKPAADVEPYMGMAGHAEIVRSDRSVFAHIHPDGSVAMAALELTQKNSAASASGNGNDAATMDMQMPTQKISPEVSFPYGFPKAGEYRMFVQIKRAGRIETGVFDALVTQ
jgi:hypothetical protein